MHEKIDEACQALDALGNAIETGWTGTQTFVEAWGWNCPAVTRFEAASIATTLAGELRAADVNSFDSEISDYLGDLPRKIKLVQTNTVPQFWGSNNSQAYSAYLSTITSIRASLYPILGWKTIPDPKMLPSYTIRRLKAIQASVDALAPDQEKLQRQLNEISQAHSAAESLPIDLRVLADARREVADHAKAVETAHKKIDETLRQSTEHFQHVSQSASEAEKLVLQCEEAYRITTTKGLAAAFDQRATKLGWTVITWVAGLMAALGAGSYLGAHRLEALTAALSSNSTNWNTVFLHSILSVLSIGAPIWFAWLATKQIGQRFRLAEDYAFKASVAKAYEGYRREAARIDPDFEARLFASALTRLEEAPLRLVETASHGSPWHEALSSKTVQQAIETIPGLKDRLLEHVQDAINATKKPVKATVPVATPDD